MFPQLEEGASAIRKMLICLLAGSGPILMLLLVGEGASTIHKKLLVARRSTINVFSNGRKRFYSRKTLFSTRAELVPYLLCQFE